MKTISKQEAKEQGFIRYFTGKPCKRGHVAERKTCNSTCVACHNQQVADFWKANPDKMRTRNLAYDTRNPEKVSAYKTKYRKNNPEKIAALTRLKQAEKILRTPSWLDADDLWVMQETYALALLRTKVTGVEWEVDHIVPLRGATVSGLHTPNNLQVITREENRRKHSKWDPNNGD